MVLFFANGIPNYTRQPDIDVLLRCNRNCKSTCQFANAKQGFHFSCPCLCQRASQIYNPPCGYAGGCSWLITRPPQPHPFSVGRSPESAEGVALEPGRRRDARAPSAPALSQLREGRLCVDRLCVGGSPRGTPRTAARGSLTTRTGHSFSRPKNTTYGCGEDPGDAALGVALTASGMADFPVNVAGRELAGYTHGMAAVAHANAAKRRWKTLALTTGISGESRLLMRPEPAILRADSVVLQRTRLRFEQTAMASS